MELVIDARQLNELMNAKQKLDQYTEVIAIAGDVRDEIHLLDLAEALKSNQWEADLVVNNASSLGVSPLPHLLDHPVGDLHTILHTNMIAPLSLLQKVKPYLSARATVINVSSDASIEAYESWGAYGSSKAGLDHMTAVLAKEYPAHRFYAFDPGDMQTAMHQAAFPGQDISDRPLPEQRALPAVIRLIEKGYASGRYSTSSLLKEELI